MISSVLDQCIAINEKLYSIEAAQCWTGHSMLTAESPLQLPYHTLRYILPIDIQLTINFG